jgi:hypothetical protein
MTLDEFVARVMAPGPAPALTPALLALWHDARGDWEAAHRVVQAASDGEAAWVHAYLHRKEGDPDNAAHWYRRARRGVAEGSLDDEWRVLATTLLSGATS